MKLLDYIVVKLSGAKTKEAPQGLCPNCWGRQEYSGKFYEAIHVEQITLDNVEEKKGWIQGYAKTHFEGIELHDGTCKICNTEYKEL